MTETTQKYVEYSYQDSQAGHHHRYLLPLLLDFINQEAKLQKRKLRILDIGCGNGSLSNEIAKKGHEVIGIEESASGIDLANNNYPNCTFVQGSVYDLPNQNLGDSFDLVISAEVIEHLFYPRELTKAAYKVLKPNGSFIITTPYHGYLKNLALALSGCMDKHFTALWDGGHIKFFSVNTLTKLLEEEGFKDLSFKFAGSMPWLWKSMLCRCYKS